MAAYPANSPYTRARRRLATSASSTMRIAPPSPGTWPRASASNGRYARRGSSLSLSRPLASWATHPHGQIDPSTAPDTISPLPRRICRRAWATASSPPAWSLTSTPLGPRMPCRIEIWPVFTA